MTAINMEVHADYESTPIKDLMGNRIQTSMPITYTYNVTYRSLERLDISDFPNVVDNELSIKPLENINKVIVEKPKLIINNSIGQLDILEKNNE